MRQRKCLNLQSIPHEPGLRCVPLAIEILQNWATAKTAQRSYVSDIASVASVGAE
jgi:hypothetical protein